MVKTTLASWTVTVFFLATTSFLLGPGTFPPGLKEDPLRLVAILVMAPLLENACMILLIEFTMLFKSKKPMVLAIAAVAVIAGLGHLATGTGIALGAGVFFGVMAYSYLAWKELPAIGRYVLTVAQHWLANLPAAILLVVAA